MGNKNLSRDTKVTLVQVPIANTDGVSDYVDMQGFEGVMFIGNLGTAGSTDDVTLAAWSASSTTSTGTAISGATQTSTAGLDDKFFCVDVFRPRDRFVRTQATISNAVEYGGTVAIQYNPKIKPTVHSSSTAVSLKLRSRRRVRFLLCRSWQSEESSS